MLLKRIYFQKLVSELDKPFVSILIGPRQVGKSTLMKQLQGECEKKGKKITYFNLEDPRDLQFFSGSEIDILNKLETNTDVLFIDEFQYLKNATKIFKIIVDASREIKIVASGSSAIEIHKHLKESLAGRFRTTRIFPLTLFETSKKELGSYLIFGGMPGLVHEATTHDKLELLNNIVQSYLLKDIKYLIKEENVRAFNHLLYLLAQNQGSVISVAGLAREVGLSEPSIQHYLEIMAQTYVCHPLESYSKNLGNELKKSKKYYLFDLGIRNSLLSDFSDMDQRHDKGVLFESFVMNAIQPQLRTNMEVKFWRTRQGDEVDFILLKNRLPYPIEVKANFNSSYCPKGMSLFLKKYPNSPGGMIITEKPEKSLIVHGREVCIVGFDSIHAIPFLSTAQ